ncbi:MAG: DUF2815 family protein [Candidatus Omnitrophica bacterium]|nr:DUF2815 family protein [Candidatus Omnitrophota bacterium]
MAKNIIKLTTPEFRVSFPSLFQPRAFGNSAPKYVVTMLIPKSTDISALQQAMQQCVTERWPDVNTRPKRLHNPIKDGDTDVMEDGTLRKEKYPEMAGHWVINASSKQRPGVVDHNVQPILDEAEVFAGCWGRATVTVFAYAPNKSNPQSKYGVGFGLQNFQKVPAKGRDDSPMTGRTKAEDDFEAIADDSAPAGAPGAAPAAGGFDSMFT